ncbi:MAG: hypothetical protein EPN97_10730 [Alphaproteobacteria bacterium]|nr:MAG: hypothetical protein EPN97_10730 [Alphaproteobacteria bacterium]
MRKRLLTAPRLLIRIGNNALFVKNLHTGNTFDGPAVIVAAREGKSRRVMAVGHQAASWTMAPLESNIVRLAPFDSHPRVLVDDFEAAGNLLQYAVRSVTDKSFLLPRAFIQVTKNLDGGVSAIEYRALQEICLQAGIGKVTFLGQDAFEGLSGEEAEQKLLEM